MNKQTVLKVLVLAVVVVGGWLLTKDGPATVTTGADHKNATYIIDGQSVSLVNGEAQMSVATSSSATVITRYFGNEVHHDINSDGREDVAFLVTQNRGGSGTFYYVVAALNTADGYVGSSALLLGDRIVPQTTEMSREVGKENIIIVSYLDRRPGESFAVQPSVAKSIWLKFDSESMQFGEVVQNFEGEADSSKMTLGMKAWVWEGALYNDGRKITPRQKGKFSLSLGGDGRFSATTDCNSMSGSYTTDKNSISFGPIASTKMYCEGSQETEFATLLENTQSYHFTSKGELIFDLKFDSGTAVFR